MNNLNLHFQILLNSLIRTLKSHKILQFFSLIDGLKNASLWREAQEGGDVCIIMADLHCCMAETNTTL